MAIKQPRIYTTDEWGASEPAGLAPWVEPSCVVIHHTTNPPENSATLEGAKQVARDIQRDHIYRNGWADSGQHFLLASGGDILESRHGTLDAIRQGLVPSGAHAPGANSSPGIECDGYFHQDSSGRFKPMPKKQWDSLVLLCAWLCATLKIDSGKIIGHREKVATACPGSWLYAQLPRLRQDVHDLLAGAGGKVEPAPPAQPAKPTGLALYLVGEDGKRSPLDCDPVLEDDTLRVNARDFAKALGYTLDASGLKKGAVLVHKT